MNKHALNQIEESDNIIALHKLIKRFLKTAKVGKLYLFTYKTDFSHKELYAIGTIKNFYKRTFKIELKAFAGAYPMREEGTHKIEYLTLRDFHIFDPKRAPLFLNHPICTDGFKKSFLGA